MLNDGPKTKAIKINPPTDGAVIHEIDPEHGHSDELPTVTSPLSTQNLDSSEILDDILEVDMDDNMEDLEPDMEIISKNPEMEREITEPDEDSIDMVEPPILDENQIIGSPVLEQVLDQNEAIIDDNTPVLLDTGILQEGTPLNISGKDFSKAGKDFGIIMEEGPSGKYILPNTSDIDYDKTNSGDYLQNVSGKKFIEITPAMVADNQYGKNISVGKNYEELLPETSKIPEKEFDKVESKQPKRIFKTPKIEIPEKIQSDVLQTPNIVLAPDGKSLLRKPLKTEFASKSAIGKGKNIAGKSINPYLNKL